MAPKKSKAKTVPKKSIKAPNKAHSSTPHVVTSKATIKHYPHSGLYWMVFLLAIVAWGGFLTPKFLELKHECDVTESAISLNLEQGFAYLSKPHKKVVLGATDERVDTTPAPTANNNIVLTANTPSSADVSNTVDKVEAERIARLRKEIQLQIPDETDDPNYPVTFIEPTVSGVEIQVDGGGFKVKKSPFMLPALAIGKHELNFRYKNKDNVVQNFGLTVVVIPRAPVIADSQKNKFISGSNVVLNGTALPGSKLVYFIGSKLVTGIVDVAKDGTWTVTITKQLEIGTHNAVFMVRKDGYSSNFSNTFTFDISRTNGSLTDDKLNEIRNDNTILGILSNLLSEDNYPYLVAAAGGLIIILVGALIFVSRRAASKKNSMVSAVSQFRGKAPNEDEDGKEIPLREKFARAGLVIKGEPETTILKDENKQMKKGKVEPKGELKPEKVEKPEKKTSMKEKTDLPEMPTSEKKPEKKNPKQPEAQSKPSPKKQQPKKEKVTPAPKSSEPVEQEEPIDVFKEKVKAEGEESNKITVTLTSKPVK